MFWETLRHRLVLPGAEAVTMEGRLSFNGQAAPGEVLLLGSQQAGSNWKATDSTDAEGRFLFKLPDLNRVQLPLRHGFSSQEIIISRNKKTGIRAALDRGQRHRGRNHPDTWLAPRPASSTGR